eukprot:scaffold162751_cov39-Attheya_sp.AAC.1
MTKSIQKSWTICNKNFQISTKLVRTEKKTIPTSTKMAKKKKNQAKNQATKKKKKKKSPRVIMKKVPIPTL